MEIKVGYVITIEGEEYAVIDKILYEGRNYILTNKYKDDEPTDIYIPYELTDGDVMEINDHKVLEKIGAIFAKNVQKKIDEINLQQKYEIN